MDHLQLDKKAITEDINLAQLTIEAVLFQTSHELLWGTGKLSVI